MFKMIIIVKNTVKCDKNSKKCMVILLGKVVNSVYGKESPRFNYAIFIYCTVYTKTRL